MNYEMAKFNVSSEGRGSKRLPSLERLKRMGPAQRLAYLENRKTSLKVLIYGLEQGVIETFDGQSRLPALYAARGRLKRVEQVQRAFQRDLTRLFDAA